MTTKALLSKILRNPDLEKQALWYINDIEDKRDDFLIKIERDLFTDFNLKLPKEYERTVHKNMIGLFTLAFRYDLEEGDSPGQYRLEIENKGYLDELLDIDEHILEAFCTIISILYRANEDGKVEIPELDELPPTLDGTEMGEVVVVAYRPTDENAETPDEKYIELLKNEAIRVVTSSPDWEPGKIDGKAVKVMYTFPINFALQ